MGGTVFLVTGAEKPKYTEKNVRLSILLGPFCYPPKTHRSSGFLDAFMQSSDLIVVSKFKFFFNFIVIF